jgi:hypothetical protein
MEQIKDFDSAAEKLMSQYLKKPTLIKGVIHLFLILYAARVAPRPPKAVLDLFENQYFKLFFFSLILWTAQFSPSTSLLIAISFMITMNYFNKKALWEFMENTEASSAPVAPSKEVALETTAMVVENQAQEPTVVQTMTQTPETIVIQPTIVETSEGTTVQNPSVVISPAIVSNENGEKLLIKPEVTVINVPTTTPAPATTTAAPAQEAQQAPSQEAAISAVSALAEGAASEEPSAPQQVAELTQVATAAVTTTQAAEAVEKLAQQAVKPEAAPVEAVKQVAIAIIEEIKTPPVAEQMKEEAGCYPIRRYDMSKVNAYSSNDFYGSI